MKKQTVLSLIAGCTMTLTASAVFADLASTKSISMSTVLQNLQASGYVAIKEIKSEAGFYKAKAIKIQGEKVEVRLDPETGKIVEPKSTKPAISMLTAIKKVEEAGYHGLYKVESEGDEYEVKALDKDGKKVSLKVDAFSGNVTKKLF